MPMASKIVKELAEGAEKDFQKAARTKWIKGVDELSEKIGEEKVLPKETNARIKEITDWRNDKYKNYVKESKSEDSFGDEIMRDIEEMKKRENSPETFDEEEFNDRNDRMQDIRNAAKKNTAEDDEIKRVEEQMNEAKRREAIRGLKDDVDDTRPMDKVNKKKDKIFDIKSNQKINNQSDYAAVTDKNKANDIYNTEKEEDIRKKLGGWNLDEEDINKYIKGGDADREKILKEQVENRKGRDLNWGEKAMYYKAPQKLATLGATAWIVSSMAGSKGQQSNAQLYGQQQPYQ